MSYFQMALQDFHFYSFSLWILKLWSLVSWYHPEPGWIATCVHKIISHTVLVIYTVHILEFPKPWTSHTQYLRLEMGVTMKSLLLLFLLCAATCFGCQKQVIAPTTTTTTPLPPVPVKVLVRKEVGNPADYFDKTFAEYQKGFSANGVLKKQSDHIYDQL